jgi:hypothetical protein
MDTQTCPHCNETIAADVEACPACGHLHTTEACDRHPEREAKGVCVICGFALCEECNEGGNKHFLCDAHSGIPVMQGWAQIYTTSDDVEAQLIRENLEVEGIDARVLSQKDHNVVAVDLGDFAAVRVLVPAYDYIEASELLSEHTDPEGDLRFGDGQDDVIFQG